MDKISGQQDALPACRACEEGSSQEFGNDENGFDILALSAIPEGNARISKESLRGRCGFIDQPLLFNRAGGAGHTYFQKKDCQEGDRSGGRLQLHVFLN
jgi:hypothetical protein